MAGEGRECLSGLGGSIDAGLAVGMQGLSGDDDDGKHDEVGKRHAREYIETAGALLALHLGRARLSPEREDIGTAFRLIPHFLQAVGSLPEEQIRRDGGT